MRRWIVVLAVTRTTAAHAQASLDDFYERTRERDEGFTDCIGYCDDRYLAALLVGAETANPSTDMLQPHLASGARFGVDLGWRNPPTDLVRTQLWADLLRVNDTGQWITDLGWRTTAFKAVGRQHGDGGGAHLSLDSVVARRTEITPSDVAELQLVPYDSIDVETEVAPRGPKVDKDGFLSLPIGFANRFRWSEGMALERRTTASVALAIRGFPKAIRHHAQLDLLRVKETSWDVAGGSASAWTVSAGYQRLPVGIDTLPIWALVGYEWAGPRSRAVYQVGGAFVFDEFDFGPEAERHFELDPRTATFTLVDSGRFRAGVRTGPFHWSVAYESVSLEDRGSLRAISSSLAVLVHGVQLGAGYRLVWTRDLMFPPQRFQVGLDWLF